MADPADEKARLSGARGEFVASLGRRLQTLRQALRELEEAPDDRSRRDSLLRRVHALGAAARVLGFASVAEALQEAERALAERQRPRTKDLAEVSRVLDVLPSLVWGAPQSLRPGRPPSAAPEELAGRQWPLTLLLYGGEELAVTLTRAVREDSVEFERAEQVEDACRAARVLGPDLAVVDADHAQASEFLKRLASDELAERVTTIVLGEFAAPEAMREFSALGAARILKKPCNPETLRRTIEELSEAAGPRRVRTARPLGDVTLPLLTRRIQAEVERGLLEAAVAGAQSTHVALGEGTEVMAAVWGALTRVRELVTLHSKGQIRFEPTGPEGAIPVAPWTREERRAGERAVGSTRDEADVPLAGRTVVVADDDPAVAWFLSGLLKTVGAEVIEAHDGFKALELARERWPDLVVSDILMPGLDGFALCRELKRDAAVRDIPVILLSWKEDLLQRVRELGAGADGYLRKEAAASTVVQRIREVMRPRARVEARLQQGGEVRGRLDGLTPRLVLELCSKSQANVRIEIVDAFHRYELHVRRGQLVSARRVPQGAANAPATQGPRVLSSLLGVNAGRFAVMPDESTVKPDFSGSLRDVFKSAVDRARVVQAALAPDRLASVTRVHFMEEELDTYLPVTPDPMKTALMQLVGGMTPRQLLLGGLPPDLLERTLSDVARRGCITHVDGPPGPEHETSQQAPEATSSAGGAGPAGGAVSAPVAPTAVKDPPAEPPRGPPAPSRSSDHGEPAPALPPDTLDGEAPGAARAASEPPAVPHRSLRPLTPAPPPSPSGTAEAGATREAETEPEVKESTEVDAARQAQMKAAFSFQLSPEPPPPSSVGSGPSSVEDIDDGAWFVSDSTVDAQQVNPPWPVEAGTLPGVGDAKTSASEEVETRTPPPARAEASPTTPRSPREDASPSGRPKLTQTAPNSEKPVDSAPDLASAIALSTLDASPPRRGRFTTKKSATLPQTKPISFPSSPPEPSGTSASAASEDELGAAGSGVTESAATDGAVQESRDEPETARQAAPELGATLLLADATPEPAPRAPVRPVVAVVQEAQPTSSPKAEVEHAVPSAPEPAEERVLSAPLERLESSEPPAPRAEARRDEPTVEPHPSSPLQPAVGRNTDDDPALDSEHEAGGPLPEKGSTGGGGTLLMHDEREPRSRARAERKKSPSPVPSSASPAQKPRTSQRESTSPFKLGNVGLGVVVVASAAASYLVVSAAVDWFETSPSRPPAAAGPVQHAAEPPAPSAVAPALKSELSAPAAKPVEKAAPSTAVAGAKQDVSIDEESLPTGMALAPGKGVLKVVTAGAHAIYVDGEFAGRGPVRIVPLPPGEHQVKIRLEGEENSYAAEVKQGRLTRFAVGAR